MAATNPRAVSDCLRIAFCLSEMRPPDTTESFYIQQMSIASRLQTNGHSLTFLGPANLEDTICTKDLNAPVYARRTWTKSSWFTLLRNASWRIQRLAGIPYLNVFSNYCFYDAAMQSLPGHDIVQERYGLYKSGVAMACKRLNLPYILFFDGDDLYEHEYAGKPITGILKWRAQQLTRYNLAAADRVLTVSNIAKSRLVSAWGVEESKVKVFPNAVDVHIYQPQPQHREKVRANLGIGDQPMILFVGGFFHWHDISGLLDAFGIVLKQCPEARLVMVGDGIHREAMIQYAQEQGLMANVIFTGALPHAKIPEMVNAADVAVAPYKENPQLGLWGSPMKLFEYMACGAAVVATGLGQIKEAIQDGKNGILTPPGDTVALADAILNLIVHPELRTQIGKQARIMAEQEYSWERYITRLEGVYDSVLRSRKIFKVKHAA